MIVTDEEKLHWRRVSIAVTVPREHLDLDLFSQEMGAGTTGPIVRLLTSTDPGTSHSHAFISPSPGDEQGGDVLIEIDTYRFGEAEHERSPRTLPDTKFFDALQDSIHDLDQLRVISVVDLYYPAEQVSWRMKMLANPPIMEGFQSEIGRISLSGVTLRFTDSPYGLLESLLEISPAEDEYRCSLTLLTHVRPDELSNVHESAIKQAEDFAHLFVEVRAEQ